ncbi:YtxH domain-containing protein [Marinilactibacillus psychrotolerans]|uniref:YtxH domain-containing protein n=1 Tax=Marinilactibacillus psychrotolerans TaxID=191770 RepID=A0ABW8UKC9_9LACT
MSKSSFSFGIALGSALGAAAAYMLAKQSGEELQQDLKGKANDSKNKMIIKLDNMVENAEMKFSEQITNNEVYNPPVEYEAVPETVAAPPEHNALENDPVTVPDIKL